MPKEVLLSFIQQMMSLEPMLIVFDEQVLTEGSAVDCPVVEVITGCQRGWKNTFIAPMLFKCFLDFM